MTILWRRTCWGGTLLPIIPIPSGWPISAMSRLARAGSTWPRSRTWPPARSWAGAWPTISGPSLPAMHCSWPSDAGSHHVGWSTTRIVACSLASTGRRNASLSRLQRCVESLGGRLPSECLSRPAVQGRSYCGQIISAVDAQVRPLREILPQQTIGVLVRATLPRAVRIAEVHLQPRVDPQSCVLRHLRPLVPGQRATEPPRQGGDRAGERIAHRRGTVPGQRWPIFLTRRHPMALHRWQVQQHREPRRPLDEGADRRAMEAEDQISLPVPWHRPVPCLGRTLADEDLGRDERLASPTRARSRDAQRPAGPQALRQLALQRTAALHVERLVDRLLADPHPRIIRVVEPQPLGDLLRAPGHTPAPVLAPPVPPTLPRHRRAGNRSSARGNDSTGQPILNVGPQLGVDREFRHLRAAPRPLGMPLCRRRPVVQVAAPRRRIPPQLPRDRRWRPPQVTRDLPHPKALRPPQRNLLPLGKGQIPSRERLRRVRQMGWRHPARLTEPTGPDWLRYPNLHRRVLARHARRDERPEPTPMLPPRNRRSPRRPQLAPQGPIRTSPTRHRTTLCHGVATTA